MQSFHQNLTVRHVSSSFFHGIFPSEMYRMEKWQCHHTILHLIFLTTQAKSLPAILRHTVLSPLHTALISAKGAALRTGGFIGDNGFYFHKDFGSYVCIQTILTDAVEPLPAIPWNQACTHCGLCQKACPSGGVGQVENCARYHLCKQIPETLRGDVYQLFGCEKCQSAMPR